MGCGALVLATLWRADAAAQTRIPATTFAESGTLDPDDQSKKKPLPYEKFEPRAPAARVGPPTTKFQASAGSAPASGAGKTGFDSTNARKGGKQKPKPQSVTDKQIAPGLATPPPAPSATNPQATATTSTTPPDNANDAAKNSFAYGPPGSPPIALGPIDRPIRKRKKTVEDDPYAALGLRSGGMLYYPAIEFIIGRDSNPARVQGGSAATTYTVAPELRMQSDWARHELKADLRGSYNWYRPEETPALSRPYFSGTVDGRIDVTRSTRVNLQGRALVSTDNPNSPNLQAGLAKLPIYTALGATAGITQRFNRVELGVRGDVDRTVYQNSQLTDGTAASNQDRNYNQYGATLHAGYELSPGFTPYVEASADTRVHDLATDFSGFQRDSKGATFKIGSTVELSRLITGEAAIGYTKRKYDDPRLDNLQGVIGNAALTWLPSALTTVKFTATSAVQESTLVGVSGVLQRDLGVQLDHSFRRWLTGTLKGGVGFDDYVGATRFDKRYYVGAGLTYKLSRFAQIKGEVRREWLRSTDNTFDYTANIFLLGLRLQY